MKLPYNWFGTMDGYIRLEQRIFFKSTFAGSVQLLLRFIVWVLAESDFLQREPGSRWCGMQASFEILRVSIYLRCNYNVLL